MPTTKSFTLIMNQSGIETYNYMAPAQIKQLR